MHGWYHTRVPADQNLREQPPAISRGLLLEALTKPAVRTAISAVAWPLFIRGNRLRTRYIHLGQIGSRPRRLIVCADFHAHRRHTGAKQLRKVVDLINAVPNVDMVAMVGDFVSESEPAAMDIFCEAFALCTHPLYATLGNHDHDYRLGAKGVTHMLESIGVRVITDQQLRLDDEVTLVGLDSCTHRQAVAEAFERHGHVPAGRAEAIDAFGRCQHVSDEAMAVLAQIEDPARTIVLGHEPSLALVHECFLHLAGHTHWGQLGFRWTQERLLPIGSHPYPAGLYERPSGHVYTTSGVGYYPPGRMKAPPEIVVIDF